ncbi:MAG: hypothetical protein MJZ81_03980 [Bacteroidales bacterium]|nr:hypothetical protein [Bacteroidales bacterium]
MDNNTASKIYEWGSYILIVAATLVFFLMDKNVQLTLLVLVIAVYLRVMMYRSRCKSFEDENDELKEDLRKLTQLLKEKEGK